MSRRTEQEIRQYMRRHGVPYNVARQVLAGNIPAGRSDGWPPVPSDYVVGAVIGHLRYLVGNGLAANDAARLVERLLEHDFDRAQIDQATAEMGDVMVVTVAAAPAGFPYIESDVVREYEYGMTLEEVTLGFDADLEIGLPSWAAEPLLDSGSALVVDGDADWVTIALPGAELECSAQLRVELEHAEITEFWIGLRED